MQRATRSGKAFAEWDGPLLVPRNPDFNFPNLVQAATELEEALYNAEVDSQDYPDISSSPHVPGTANVEPDSSQYLCDTTVEVDLPYNSTGINTRLGGCALSEVSVLDNGGLQGLEETETEEAAHLRRKRKKGSRAHSTRAKKRKREHGSEFSHHIARPSVQEKYINTAVPILTAKKLVESNVSSTGFVGLDDRVRDKHEYTLEELVGPSSELKFDYVAWKGDKPIPIISKEGILTAVLAGVPDSLKWPRLAHEAIDLLKNAEARCHVPDDARLHRRGAFVALSCGVSHGGGQKRPSNLRASCRENEKILQELNAAEPFQRLAGFSTSVMAHWAPDLHEYYSTYLSAIHEKYPDLRRMFPSSVFAASSYNLGPRTVCFPHTDFANIPFGWCSVTAFGDYDPTKGGHLILWDCRLVIEFPPGSTILLPSAIITHSNVPISAHETRFSYAQYTAGALVRWVEHDFQKSTDFKASLSKEELKEWNEKNSNRWLLGLSLLPRYKIPSADVPGP